MHDRLQRCIESQHHLIRDVFPVSKYIDEMKDFSFVRRRERSETGEHEQDACADLNHYRGLLGDSGKKNNHFLTKRTLTTSPQILHLNPSLFHS